MCYSMNLTASWRWNILMQRTGQFLHSNQVREKNHSSAHNYAHNQQVYNQVRNQTMNATVPPFQQIVLANQPRLLREMLGRVFSTTPGLQVVAEVEDATSLAEVCNKAQITWLIVTLGSDGAVPTQLPNRAKGNAFLSLMAISPDGKQVEVQTTAADGNIQSYTFYDISLAVLLSILSQSSNSPLYGAM